MNVLFVCSRNRWRSLTAEEIFKKKEWLSVRSAGTSPQARVKITEKLMQWADLVFVMEKKHKQLLMDQFPHLCAGKQMIVLDIEDEYSFMDEDLIEILKTSVSPYLNEADYH